MGFTRACRWFALVRWDLVKLQCPHRQSCSGPGLGVIHWAHDRIIRVITIIMLSLSSYGATWELKPFFLHTHEEWGKGELWGLLFLLTRWLLQIGKRSEMVREKMQSEVPTYPWQWLRASKFSSTEPRCCSQQWLRSPTLIPSPSLFPTSGLCQLEICKPTNS